LKKKRFIIVGVIALAALVYIVITAFQHGTTRYYTVSTILEQSASVAGETVRVSGGLSTITQGAGTGASRWQFVLSENGKDLPVVYQGIVPDAFKVGNELMVEGRLDPTGVFQAQTIITKCPSKYEPAKQ
jgi:cytochrome c-type biogenesis protein CcmE